MDIYQIDNTIRRCFAFVAFINVAMSAIIIRSFSGETFQAATAATLEISGTICVYAVLSSLYACVRTRGPALLFSAFLLISFAIMLQVESGSTFEGIGVITLMAVTTAAGLAILAGKNHGSVLLAYLGEVCTYLTSRNSFVLLVAITLYLLSKLAIPAFKLEPEGGAAWLLHQTGLLCIMTMFIYSACPYLRQRRGT